MRLPAKHVLKETVEIPAVCDTCLIEISRRFLQSGQSAAESVLPGHRRHTGHYILRPVSINKTTFKSSQVS